MKRTPILIVTFAAVLAGALPFFSYIGVFHATGATEVQAASAESPASQYQGHAGGGAPATSTPAETVAAPPQTRAEEAPAIEIPVEKQQLIGVRTVAAAVQPMQTVIRTVGRIDYDERGLATINTKFEGWIEKLFVNVTGSLVKKGQPLAEIYSPELYATQQEFINALRYARQNKAINSEHLQTMLARDAEAIIEAARQRLKLWDISEAQIRKISETGRPIRTLTIQSPVDGAIIQKPVIQGMRVMPGEKMFDIADLSTVWLVADLYESQMSLVKTGQAVTISFNNFPGMTFSSTIDFVFPMLSGETRTVRVRCTIPNPKGQLKPQMFATMEIKADQGERLAVPDDAVIDTGAKKVVYVDHGEGMFEPREVMTGLKADGLTEVVSGIEPGEKVAAAANFLIDSEAQLKGISASPHQH